MGRVARILAVVAALLASAAPVLHPEPARAAERPVASTAMPPGALGGVAGDVDDFSFRSMAADYTLGRADDGSSTLRVVETFVAVFPDTDQNHGMRRSIPDTYNGQPLFPRLVSITDEHGAPRAAEADDEDGAFTMTSRADGFVHGAQTYVFTYTLRNVTWHFADTGDDEFYWDVNGVDWPQPFASVSATVHLDRRLADALTGRQSCYRGSQGATDACAISARRESDGSVVVAAQTTGLDPRQTMTVAIGFASGTFVPFDASFLASPWGWLQGVAGLGMAAVIVFAAINRRRRLRDGPGRPTIIPEYTPPTQIDALQAAVLLGRPQKGIPAEVLEQAVTGSIRIVEGDRKLFGGHRLQAELIDRSRADGDGRMLLAGLFGKGAEPGAVFEFGRQDTRFSSAAQRILKWADGNLTTIGLRRTLTAGSRALPILLGAAAAVALVALGIAALGAGVNGAIPVTLAIAAIPAFLVVVGLSSRRPLSAEGAEVRDHLRGLEMFIEWAEADRIRMLQSPAGAERVRIDPDDPRQMLRLYESLLPYAVVFGQERQWAARLAVMYGTGVAPYWYAGTHGFDASSFSAGIGTLSSAASSSSSTSGGSGGGGSAGGGGGGGGGGGV